MKYGGMGRRTALRPGDWVEWMPTEGKWTHKLPQYVGETGIVYAIRGDVAVVRFPDLTFHELNRGHLSWQPNRRQFRTSAEAMWHKHLAELPNPAVAPDGRPHTFSDGPRRAGSTPGGKD